MENKKTILIIVAVIAVIAVLVLIFANPFDKTKKMVGKYELVEMSLGSMTLNADALKASGESMTLEIKKKNEGTITMSGENGGTIDIKYDEKEIEMEGEKVPYTFKDKKITIEKDGTKMVFEKK